MGFETADSGTVTLDGDIVNGLRGAACHLKTDLIQRL
jgi:hypothetical protein